jgi:hypothetical protein
MTGDEILNEATPVISQNWELEAPAQISYDDILNRLSATIRLWLKTDFGRLVNALYRHDVAEPLFHQAMNHPTIEERAEAIAQLVLQRELQKAESRLKYKGRG